MSAPAPERQTETKTVIYMPRSMREELERTARAEGEGTGVSRIVRQALREFFKKHPQE